MGASFCPYVCVTVCVLKQVFVYAPAVQTYNSHLLDIKKVMVGRCLSVHDTTDSQHSAQVHKLVFNGELGRGWMTHLQNNELLNHTYTVIKDWKYLYFVVSPSDTYVFFVVVFFLYCSRKLREYSTDWK